MLSIFTKIELCWFKINNTESKIDNIFIKSTKSTSISKIDVWFSKSRIIDSRFSKIDSRFSEIDPQFLQNLPQILTRVEGRFRRIQNWGSRFSKIDSPFSKIECRFPTIERRFSKLSVDLENWSTFQNLGRLSKIDHRFGKSTLQDFLWIHVIIAFWV